MTTRVVITIEHPDEARHVVDKLVKEFTDQLEENLGAGSEFFGEYRVAYFEHSGIPGCVGGRPLAAD